MFTMASYLPHILLLVLAVVSITYGDPSDPYAPECAPPPSVTVPPGNGSTTTEYPQMAPIEKCCPQCSNCVDIGGYCMIKWITELVPQWCDFEETKECKDYGCKCCIKCGDDSCSTCVQTGGECRSECRADEQEDTDNQCTYYNNGSGCKCCKKCEATSECTDASGKCVTNPNDCPLGTFASTGCCGGCYCCKPVLQEANPGDCSDNGAYCSETEECASGFWSKFGACLKTLTVAGLESTELGYCCVPKVAATRREINLVAGARNIERPPYGLNGAAVHPERPKYGRRSHPKYLQD